MDPSPDRPGNGGGVIRIEGLEAGFRGSRGKAAVLSGLDAGVGRGELIALVGRNGSGKTTLIRTLCGLLPVLGGTIDLFGRSLSDYPVRQLARLIGYVSTDRAAAAGLDVFTLVALGRIPHTNWLGKLTGEDRRMVEHSLEVTGLSPIRHRSLNEISDGERQRAMIARTLAQDTPIIILDEPTAFLDVIHRFEIMHLLHGLTRSDERKTVVLSSHDLQIAMGFADRFWILGEGRIADGAPEDLVLRGEIGNLSAHPVVFFDREAGQFAIRSEGNEAISLCGEQGQAFHWTARALERMGYSVDPGCNNETRVTVLMEGRKTKWRLEKNSERLEFYNIYQLTLRLRKEKP